MSDLNYKDKFLSLLNKSESFCWYSRLRTDKTKRLFQEADFEIENLQEENDVLRKEYNKVLDYLSECEDKRCKVIEEKKEMRLEIERMRARLKKEERVDE